MRIFFRTFIFWGSEFQPGAISSLDANQSGLKLFKITISLSPHFISSILFYLFKNLIIELKNAKIVFSTAARIRAWASDSKTFVYFIDVVIGGSWYFKLVSCALDIHAMKPVNLFYHSVKWCWVMFTAWSKKILATKPKFFQYLTRSKGFHVLFIPIN